jgi:hypothetical protein
MRYFLLFISLSFAMTTGCATSKTAEGTKDRKEAVYKSGEVSESGNDVVSETGKDGFPKWLKWPRHGLKSGMIAGVGISNLAPVSDLEAAKSEAELVARNRIAQEIETNIRSTVTKASQTSIDSSDGATKKVSFKKLNEEDISNIVAKRIVGARIDEWFMVNADGKEDMFNVNTVYVRIILDMDIKALAEDLGTHEGLTDEEKSVFADSLRQRFMGDEAAGAQ